MTPQVPWSAQPAGSSALLVPSKRVRDMADEVALATPPTITDETNTTSTITNSILTPSVVAGAIPANTPFRYEVVDQAVINTNYVIALGQSNTSGVRVGDESWTMTAAFDFDGQVFEMWLNKPFTASRFRVWANEQVSAWTTIPNSGTARYFKIDFGSRAYRRIVIEGDRSFYFGGIVAAKTDSVMPSSLRSIGKLAIVGDSYSIGVGVNGNVAAAQGYANTLSRLLGFVNRRVYGISGTGVAKEPGAASPAYPHRIGDVLGYQPDVCIVQGSINDTAGTVPGAAPAYLAALKAGLPATSKIIVTSPLRALATNAADVTNTADWAAACAALGIPFIDLITTPIFNGTGNVGTPASDGNADNYQSNNPTGHPSQAGHFYGARQLALRAAPLLGLAL